MKGVLTAREAARALAEGFGRAGAAVDEVPIADGGEGTAAALHAALGGEWRAASVSDPLGREIEARYLVLPDGRAVVEAAEAIGLWRLAVEERDPVRASSRGLGELMQAAVSDGAERLLVALGGTATVDGGVGLGEVLSRLAVDVVALCDVRSPLVDAARVFARQKGAASDQVEALERRLLGLEGLRAYAELPGAGAAGGLGAALAALGARLVPGADFVVEAVGLRGRLEDAALAVTGEGTVDRTSLEGKATGVVARLCAELGVPCVVFGGQVEEAVPGAETVALSGDPSRARVDLVELGERLGLAV